MWQFGRGSRDRKTPPIYCALLRLKQTTGGQTASLSQYWLLSCVELNFLLTSSAGHGVCTPHTHTYTHTHTHTQWVLAAELEVPEEQCVLTAEPSLQPRIVLIFMYTGVLPAYISIHYVPGPEEN